MKVTSKNASDVTTQVVEYAYGANDRLYRRVLDSDGNGQLDTASVFVRAGDQIAIELERSDATAMTASDVSRRVVWLPAGVDQPVAEEHVGGETYWTLTDRLATVRDLVYHNGTAVILAQHNELDAFGRLLSTPTVETLALYTGRFYDVVTGLQYNRARWYDASVGRWMSVDQIGFEAGDANLYRYVGNRVLWKVDPEGLATRFPPWDELCREAERRRMKGPWKDSAQHCWLACVIGYRCGLGGAAGLLGDIGECCYPGEDPLRDIAANHWGGSAGDSMHMLIGPAACFYPHFLIASYCDAMCLTGL